MKIRSSVLTLLFCASLMIPPPIASAAPANTPSILTAEELDQALKKLPANAKRLTKEAIDLYGLEATLAKVDSTGRDEWQVNITSERSILSLRFSQNGKLLSLAVTIDQLKSTRPISQATAYSLAAEFTSRLLGDKYVPADLSAPFYNDYGTVDIYPVINQIPVERRVATLTVSSAGYVSAFYMKNETVNESSLPQATSLLTEKTRSNKSC